MDGVCDRDAPADAARLTASEAACQAVFNTAELLEHIFSQLLPSQVIGAQRVCRQFRDIVATSPMLQLKVFSKLESSSKSEQKWALEKIDRYPRPPIFIYKLALDEDADQTWPRDSTKILSVASLNSAFLEQVGRGPFFSKSACFMGRWNYAGARVTLRDVKLRDYILKYAEAESLEADSQSWTDLHITDPPCRRAILCILINFTSDFGVSIWSKPVIAETGVTMRKLMDALPETVHFMCRFNDGHPTGLVEEHPERSIRQVVAEYQKHYRTRGRIEHMSVFLPFVMCPTDSEREEFERGELCGQY